MSLDGPLGAFTSGFQIQTMVQESNNDSWSLLMDAVGLSELSEYAASIDVTYDPEVNTLSTADMAHILAELFEGRLLDQEHTEQLLSYMQDQLRKPHSGRSSGRRHRLPQIRAAR